MKDSIILGADIGGSHITAALIDLEQRKVLKDTLVRNKVEPHGSADQIMSVWCETLAMASTSGAVPFSETKVGIAMPGPFDYDKGVSFMNNNDKYGALYGLNVKKLLAGRIGIDIENIMMMNDAACFMKGEVFAGAARHCKMAIAFTIGTGIGTARFKNGQSEDADLWCIPFHNSIADDYLTTRWIVNAFFRVTGKRVNDVKELITHHSQDEGLKTVFDEFSDNLTLLLQYFIKLDEPEIVIMGGNISNVSHYFLPRLQANLKQAAIDIEIRRSMLGEEAAMLGAASFWFEREPS